MGATRARPWHAEPARSTPITSYSQNAEDVRLWRVFGSKPEGFYVDVGAGHPVDDSVTKLFYESGWSGVNLEPGPDFALLERLRPRDVNLEVAVSDEPGVADMWISWPDPGLSSFTPPPPELLPAGFEVRRTSVRTVRLEDVLAEYATGRTIDFLKIDVEGAERSVLASFDPRSWRASVIVVEAISPLENLPAHDDWETSLLDAGYLLAAFDGVNRFYVAEEHEPLAPVLAYPISSLDRFVRHRVGEDARLDSLEHVPALVRPYRSEITRLEAELEAAASVSAEMRQTLSWRLTAPLRAVRRRQLARSGRGSRSTGPAYDRAEIGAAVADRAGRASQLLCPELGPEETRPSRGAFAVDDAFRLIEEALSSTAVPAESAAWLALVAIDGWYPTDEDVGEVARVIRMGGAGELGRLARRRFDAAVQAGVASTRRLDVISDELVVVPTHIATSDFHTGIQRVARETVAHWCRTHPALRVAVFDEERAGLALLVDVEVARLVEWRDHLTASTAQVTDRPAASSESTLVPWRCHLIVPELPGAAQCHSLRALAASGVTASLSLICFDLVPIVAAETLPPGLAESYAAYLSLVKHADRVSAISGQSAADFEAFTSMLTGEGRSGPTVVAHPLPTVVPGVIDGDQEGLRRALAVRGLPLVLVVGSHDPRKNHLLVLEAAERLWRSGCEFELVFAGSAQWGELEFFLEVERLQAAGRPLSVRSRASEAELWTAYRLARFTVYLSLLEGFGLPIAESLAAGTPVITSGHGSMAEVAAGGGALLVDPRNVDEVAREMRRLLEDDELLDSLRREAEAREFGTWADYADTLWRYFVPT